jgi:hypothetical protein
VGEQVSAPQIVIMDLPFDQDVLWYKEFNIVAITPRFDRQLRVDRTMADWRSAMRPMSPSFS